MVDNGDTERLNEPLLKSREQKPEVRSESRISHMPLELSTAKGADHARRTPSADS